MSQQYDNQQHPNDQDGRNAGRADGAGLDNTVKDPDDWATGDEPMTGAQRSYIETLSEAANEPPPGDLSKADASKKIDELREKTGAAARS